MPQGEENLWPHRTVERQRRKAASPNRAAIPPRWCQRVLYSAVMPASRLRTRRRSVMPSWVSTGKVRNSAWSKRVWRASGMARHRLHSVNDAPSAATRGDAGGPAP